MLPFSPSPELDASKAQETKLSSDRMWGTGLLVGFAGEKRTDRYLLSEEQEARLSRSVAFARNPLEACRVRVPKPTIMDPPQVSGLDWSYVQAQRAEDQERGSARCKQETIKEQEKASTPLTYARSMALKYLPVLAPIVLMMLLFCVIRCVSAPSVVSYERCSWLAQSFAFVMIIQVDIVP